MQQSYGSFVRNLGRVVRLRQRSERGTWNFIHDDTDQHCRSIGRNWPPSYWDMAEFFDFLQIGLDVDDGNRADLPVSLPFDALQRRGAAEYDREFKYHLAAQSPLF